MPVFAVILLLLLGTWAAWSFATDDENTIHIFPTGVDADGWKGEAASLEQHLSERATFSDFSEENAASILFVNEGNRGGQATGEEEEASSATTTHPLEDEHETETPLENVPDQAEPLPAESTQPEPSAPTETASSSAMRAVLTRLAYSIIPPVFAQEEAATDVVPPLLPEEEAVGTETTTVESGSSVTPIESSSSARSPRPVITGSNNADDVTVCAVRNDPCHVIEFTGFSVGGALTETDLSNLSLRLSLGWRAMPGAIEDDKLFIRYFFNNAWHIGGEIPITAGESSNLTNGGHYLFALPEGTDWSVLENLKVQIEYVRESDVAAEIYLDGIWIDAAYEGEVEIDQPNIFDTLAALEASSKPEVLVIGPGEEITFPYGSDVDGSTLSIRTHEPVARGLSHSEAYLSITNRSPRAEDVTLSAYLPEGAEVKGLSRWQSRIAHTRAQPVRSTVGYFCEQGWATTTNAASFVCSGTREERSCDVLNEEGTNCIIDDGAVSVDEEITHLGGWVPMPLDEGEAPKVGGAGTLAAWFRDGAALPRPEGYVHVSHTPDTIRLSPGESMYVKADIGFSAGKNGIVEFLFEGDMGGYGRAALVWESAWRYRVSVSDAANPVSETPRYIELVGDDFAALTGIAADGHDIRAARVYGEEQWDVADASFRMPLSLPKVDATASSSQVAVDISMAGASFFSRALRDGSDIVLTDSDGMVIAHELLRYDRRSKYAVVGISAGDAKRLSLSGGNLYFGTGVRSGDVAPETDRIAGAVNAVVGGLVRYTPPQFTELPVWVHHFNAETQSAGVWVKDIPSEASSTLYLYFGNPRAPGVADEGGPFESEEPIARARLLGSEGDMVWMGAFASSTVRLSENEQHLSRGSSIALGITDDPILAATRPLTVVALNGKYPTLAPVRDDRAPTSEEAATSSSDATTTQSRIEDTEDGAIPEFAEWGATYVLPPGTRTLSVTCDPHSGPVTLTVMSATGTPQTATCSFSEVLTITPDGGEEFGIGSMVRGSAAFLLEAQFGKKPVRLWGAPEMRGNFPLLTARSFGAVEILPVVTVAVSEGVDRTARQLRMFERKLKNPDFNTLSNPLHDFSAGEEVTFDLTYIPQRNAVVRWFRNAFFKQQLTIESVRVLKDGIPVEIRPDIDYTGDVDWHLSFGKLPRAFVPGTYTVEVSIAEGNVSYTDTFEFYWGVLAVNTDQTVYAPGDEAFISMAALDDAGSTICDALLSLSVTTPGGAIESLPVSASGECGPNNVIDTPDYSSRYQIPTAGTYHITLSHLSDAGQVVHRIDDEFTVVPSPNVTVTRTGPTRIYPKAPYTMSIEVVPTEDFEGTITEMVPMGFEISNADDATIEGVEGGIKIAWEVAIKAGTKKTLSYTFDAPDVSPYMYYAGPLTLTENGNPTFTETRQWQIASDALGTYVEKASQWSATSGSVWQTKDLSASPFSVPANAIVEIAIINNDTANEHSAGIRGATTSLDRRFLIHEAEPQGADITVMHTQVSSTSTLQHYTDNTTQITFQLMGYWTSGTYVDKMVTFNASSSGSWATSTLAGHGLAAGSVAEFVIQNFDANNELSAGVRQIWSSLDRRVNIHEAEAGGVDTRTLFVMASTSNAQVQLYAQTAGATSASIDHSLVGYWSTLPTGLAYVEKFATLTGPTSNSVWTDTALSSAGAPTSSIAEIEFSNIADANLSMLIGARANGSALDRSFNVHESEAGGENLVRTHVLSDATGSSTIELFSDDTANDAFRLLGYWAASNTPPAAPTLYDIPFDNEKTGSSSPPFEFTASDPDGASSIVYQIQWDDDPDLDNGPIGDRSSDDESGCTPNCFENLTTPADTSPFNEGGRVRFTIRSGLTTNTTYYWRVRGTDVSGSGIAGDWSETRSFTYTSGTDPSQWFQTEDEQFDDGTLSGVEINGSDSVQIVASDPVGALIAYGEGVVQTPRFRTWDGSAWSSEGSANSVGGTIQWVVTRAGTTRDEYVVGTQDASADVNLQVYNGTSTTWSSVSEITTAIADVTNRGFDIAYETNSGDAIAVSCDGDADPRYSVWNGSTWSATSTINLSSANNCEIIKLESDPFSDEIILVARDTGATYEAQVWDGNAWGSSLTLGSMNQALHEGIAVKYEESGDQAMVVVSNGINPSFVWSTWNGTNWGVVTTQALGDDFESGILAADVGTDRLALCYADEDDDMGYLLWDGDGWGAATELELALNISAAGTVDGRPVSCEFETTSGRDGYLMIPYSDTTASRYIFYNGSTNSTEASISTIQDSWTVGSIRTGEGKILTTHLDDVNSRYDFSYWDGSTWSAAQTLENSPSVTAEPYQEAVMMAAKIYQPASGTITSEIIDFDSVASQITWGEVLWNTDEPSGTNVLLKVKYATTSTSSLCTTLVPNGTLPGNSSGFDISQSPLDISALSTSTYNRICLEATLTSTNQNSPLLEDWTIAWERQPYLSQSMYHWYINSVAATPSDAWPSGTTELAENEAIPVLYGPKPADVLRLRIALRNDNVSLTSGSRAFRLEYAETNSCAEDGTDWVPVGAIGSTTAKWRGYNISGLSDGATISSNVLSTSTVSESYEEENDTVTNPATLAAGARGEWEFVLEHNASSSMPYCFRMVNSDGTALNVYSQYPELVTNDPPSVPEQEKLFDNELVGTTTPSFEFVSDDPQNEDITYQIQVDDDNTFGSVAIDVNSQTNFNDFLNIVRNSDKNPFFTGETVRYTPTSALSDGVTYWWRVRAKDPSGTNEWSEWSGAQSFTINTAVTITSWFQTTQEQFDTDDLVDTETTASDDVILTSPLTTGTTTPSSVDFDWRTTGNAWGSLSWSENETTGDIRHHIEYQNGAGVWARIPDADLSGNSSGFGGSSVSLLGVDPTTYNVIRPVARFTDIGGSPRLLSWTLAWGLAVEQPTVYAPFDNEKVSTTTPTFEFVTDDPQSDDLEYEVSWSTDNTFTSSTTRRSGTAPTGFTNTASTTDTSPFTASSTMNYKIQAADVLTNGNTYWWRVRARDPSGGNTWSVWSTGRSFTVDTSITVSTWFQTTDEQFDTDTLTDLETTGTDGVEITSVIREAMVAYGEGTAQAPRYRIWNGSSWGSELTGSNISDRIYWIKTAAAPTRDEYAITTIGSAAEAQTQIFNGTTDTWGNLVSISNISNSSRRGAALAYETTSGDLISVACRGVDAVYRVWNGSSWTSTSTINLASANNCEWIQLASDPTSDEIIMITRDTVAGTNDYEAWVWSGSSWGNNIALGSMSEAADEGMAVGYEESGNQALIVVSNGLNANFLSRPWNGSVWGATSTVALGDDFEGGILVPDNGSDEMALCYVDEDINSGFVEWNGSAWGSFTEVEAVAADSKTGRPISCQYETTSGRDNYLMIPYSDSTLSASQYWNGSALSGEVALSTIQDSNDVISARTDDGNILALFYDDTNTQYDFSYWNGTSWATAQSLETNTITGTTPRTGPIDMVARRYPSFTSGTILGSAIDFDDGNGPKWQSFSFSGTKPGSSQITYKLEYQTATGSWATIPSADLPGNETGTTTGTVNLGSLSFLTYNVIRPRADLTCVSGQCPVLNDWTVAWSEGITVSGTAKAYDQSTNLTSGTVAVAVNGTLQAGKTATISGGTFSIANVTVFSGDTVTVFIDGAATTTRAVAATVYDGVGDITGVELISRHLSLGTPSDSATTTNSRISLYDNSVSGDNDVFFDVSSGDLTVCAISGCEDSELYIVASSTFIPSTSTAELVYTHDIEINGTVTGSTNTFEVSGSWDNDGTWNANTATVIFDATSTTETIDSTGATTSAFYVVTFGQTSGAATWNLQSDIDIDSTLTIAFGTLAQNGGNDLALAGNLSIQSGGGFSKGTGTTTFDGSGSNSWTDSTTAKQNMGNVVVDGSSKTVSLGAAAKASNLVIGSDDLFTVSGNHYALTLTGNLDNNNIFTANQGTITFTGTSSNQTVEAGSSTLYNVTFQGTGGTFTFPEGSFALSNNFTVASGTVTLPTGTTTIGGSYAITGGAVQHNNGTVLFNATASGKTVTASTSPFYNLTFSGSGGVWTFSGNATSSNNLRLAAGTMVLPSGMMAIGGALDVTGGTVSTSNGTIRFYGSAPQTVNPGGASLYNVIYDGTGAWSYTVTSATTTNNFTVAQGSVTLPSGTLALGGSYIASSTVNASNGTLRFYATDQDNSIYAGTSTLSTVRFQSTSGGWTWIGSATTTGAFDIFQASSFILTSGSKLGVGGTFQNLMGGASTTWTGTTLHLYSGTTQTINTKSAGGDAYGTLSVGTSTDIKMWNSSATAYSIDPTGSLYSQDHSAVDGDLYIWGEYLRTSGTDYWSYATDFDGTALGGSSRQVDVRIAGSSSVRIYNGSTLQMVGGSAATTTVASQDNGFFELTAGSSTVNAQYYAIEDTATSGFSIIGSSTVTSLANGAYTLTYSGGTMLTAGSGPINGNPELQILAVSFGTSTGVVNGYNVTASGTPTSFWWFREHYGAYDGEAYDNDPGGDPGNIRFDDSGYTISISGTVYDGEGQTPSTLCNSVTNVVRIVVDGGGAYDAPCTTGTGAYTIPGIAFAGDADLIAFLNNANGRGATVSRTPTSNITGFDIYRNRVIVRHEDVDPIAITHMATYDSSHDTDIPFNAATGSPNTLTVEPNTALLVWSGKTFAPGGNVTLQSGGSGQEYDGTLRLYPSAVFTAAGTESHSIGGGFLMDTGATFTPATAAISFTATTTGKYIAAQTTLYDASFTGTNGGWYIARPLTVTNNVAVSAGTLAGTSTLTVSQGTLTGNGTVSMTAGTVTISTGGTFGGATDWSFNNLTFGSGSTGSSSKSGAGDITIGGVLTIAASHTLSQGAVEWILSGSGSPLSVAGTLTSNTATTTFSGTSATAVPAAGYYTLNLAPSGAGSPTYTFGSGSFTVANDLFIGSGAFPVTVTANTNDPLITVSDDVTIAASATYQGSNTNDLLIAGSYINDGTYTSNSGGIVFNSTDTGEVVEAGASSFHNVSFNNAGGGWTINENATSTGAWSITSGSAFTAASGIRVAVGGTFTNTVGGAATTWTNTTLSLYSGTNFTINTKAAGNDIYNILSVEANTDVRMWNSSASTYSVATSGSLYSQDHAVADGDLYIWGDYVRSSGNDYWSYATDFDGTALGGSSRQVDVRFAALSTTTLSGGGLEIVGASNASTTIASFASSTYGISVTGGTLNARYYTVQNMNSDGLSISGSPTITELGNGDFTLSQNGGSMITVTPAVINANPLKTFRSNRFATSSGVSTGFNVRVTSASVSSWRFAEGFGNLYGENYDSDPGGDPGNVIFDDSAADITVSGNIYSDEGLTVSPVCDGVTPVVQLLVEGATPQSTSCNATSGAYAITNIFYSAGDSILVYLNTNGGRRGVAIAADPVSTIGDMDLYENRVIVRHEDSAPIAIDDMAAYDSDNDSDILYNATTTGVDTLTVVPNTALIVWDAKTFTPNGNVTLQSGGSGTAYDGTLSLYENAAFVASGTESHSIGGSFLTATSASLTEGNSTFSFTATTTSKTISPNGSNFYNLSFTGSGGTWSFADTAATATNDVIISAGIVTMPTSSLAVGGSFDALGGAFSAGSSTINFTSASPETIRLSGSSLHSLIFSGVGAFTMSDTNATTTGNVAIAAGSVALPSGTLAVGGSFTTAGTFSHGGTLRFTSTAINRAVSFNTSKARNVVFDGSGSWNMTDTNATTTGTFRIYAGAVTAPSGLLSIGASFDNNASFNANAGRMRFFGTTTNLTIESGGSALGGFEIDGAGGSFTITESATSSGAVTLRNANTVSATSTISLAVGGTFTNLLVNASTSWNSSTLYLNSATAYTINTKTLTERYNKLLVGSSTDVRMWGTTATTTEVWNTGSLYSMDHAATDGDLYIWGEYVQSGSADYWSYATDFDGVALGGSSRQVDVRVATGSSILYSGGSLDITGTAAQVSTVANQGAGTYSFAVTGGTFSAQHYQLRNLNASGLSFSGTPVVSELSNGDYQLAINGGAMLTVAHTVFDANPTKTFSSVSFATSSGVATGTNVTRTGSTINFWTFSGSSGNYDGEAYDSDGTDACGAVRWSDSLCLEVSQAHYRFRADDGGEGAVDDEWYDGDWAKRKPIAVFNASTTALTSQPVKITVAYDSEMQSDFDDLRFTDSTGTSSIPYWIESMTPSGTTTVWVKVPTLAADDTTYIYMYYGNGAAANAQSGIGVFNTMDDFEDDNITEYSGDTSLFDTLASFNYQGNQGLGASAGNEENVATDGIYRTTGSSTVARGSRITFYQYVDATTEDEPCALFAVQSPGSSNANYAVCLDQFTTEKLSIARDVDNSDDSGIIMASTSVSYSTGWYKVVVDWYSTSTISAFLYQSNGTLVASTTAYNAAYSTGGYGFTYWAQSGGWDGFFVRPYMAIEPWAGVSVEQGSGGATWLEDQDTSLTGQSPDDDFRIRFGVVNSGPQIDDQNIRLQFAPKGEAATCEAVDAVEYNDVPTTCGSSALCMAASANLTNQAPTTQLLFPTLTATFTPGTVVENPSNESNDIDIQQNYFTEVEFAVDLTDFADEPSYCLRVTDGGLEFDTYPRIPELSLEHLPTISGWRLNYDDPIALTEGTTTTIMASATVTDLNGYEDILNRATSSIYRSSFGAFCSDNPNNCYQLATSQCPMTSCSGDSCTVTCSADLQYFADPTDPDSPYVLQEWRAFLSLSDQNENYATSTADGVELQTMWALDLEDPDIDYGTLQVGADTGAVNASTTLENTGNADIDIDLAGSDLTGSGNSTISVANQKFATSSFTYSACAICQFLSGTSTTLELELPKATATATPSTDSVFWGIYVPLGTAGVTHAGTTTFFATGD